MWPIVIQFGSLTIYSYGLSLAIAALICGWLMARDAKRFSIPVALIYDLMFYTVIAGIIGARIFYVAMAWDYYHDKPLEILLLNQGGLAWQGGFVGAVMAGIIFAKWRRISIPILFDLAAPYIALGQAIGRLGCFANGCCYGKPVSWGIYFPLHHAKLHPTQLYEAVSLAIIYVLLKSLAAKKHNPGMIFVGYLWLVAIERFVVEFYRADQMAVLGPLSLFQWIAVGIFIAGIIIYLITHKKTNA